MKINKYDFFSEIDKIRWKNNSNLDNINYAKKLDNEQIILTHWICYITDRMMPYELIWHVGGFVFSDIIYEYKNKNCIDLLKPNGVCFKEDGHEGFSFCSVSDPSDNEIIRKKYSKYIDGSICRFKSRFYNVDYFSIYYTLSVLEKKYEKSIISYIAKIVEIVYKAERRSTKSYIEAIAKGLYLLTYHNNKNKGIDSLKKLPDFNQNVKLECDSLEKRINYIDEWMENGCNGELCSSIRFKSAKRIWCSLRDYIKSPFFKEPFSIALKGKLSEQIWNNFNESVLMNENGCRYVELPGDVWNNNSIFRDCFGVDNSKSINEYLREKYGNDNNKWYPEQFDVTFDFVPRMCNVNNCHLCILSPQYDREKVKIFCINTPGKICPLILLYCGYHYVCNDDCKIKCLLPDIFLN